MDKSTLCERQYTVHAIEVFNGTYYDRATRTKKISWTNYRSASPPLPDWKARIAAGLDATTPMSGFIRTVFIDESGNEHLSSDPGRPENYLHVFGSRVIYDMITSGGVSAFDTALETEAIGKARTNFVRSYRKAITQWNSGQFIGELAETVRFLKSPARAIINLTDTLIKKSRGLVFKNRRKLITGSDMLKQVTDGWLGYQYAVKPLVNDVNEGYQALREHVRQHPTSFVRLFGTATASKSARSSLSCSNNLGVGFPGFPQFRSQYRSSTDFSVRIRGAYKIENPNREFPYWDALGLSKDQFIPTVYEILPFSFLIDYFSNLGAVIDAHSFQFVQLAWSNMTKRQVYLLAVDPLRSEDTTTANQYAHGGSMRDTSTVFSRASVNVNNLVSPITLRLPGTGQALNTVALINSLTSLSRM